MATETTEILVIGGGITGIGVALEAASWGFDTLLCERGKLASETSANSLRIIHGGLRYLQSADLRRVLESAAEQSYWLREAPRFVAPLECVMPLAAHGLRSALPARVAAYAYGAALRFVKSPLQGASVLSRQEAEKKSPILKRLAPCGVLYWQDALLRNPGDFVAFLAERISSRGGRVQEHVSVAGVERAGKKWRVTLSNGTSVESVVVVDTTGLGAGAVTPKELQSALGAAPNGWCHALNIEFGFPLEAPVAIGVQSSAGRLFFAVPRAGNTAIGTWYYPWQEQELPSRKEEQIELYLAELRESFGDDRICRENVVGIDAGILPMQRSTAKGPELYGRHQISACDGFVRVLSTKYTTFRLVGQEVMQAVKDHLQQAELA